MERKELRLDGLTVRYYEAGAGPALLLLHGAGGTARLWHRQLGPLSSRFRVLAPDLPGFGGTGLPPYIRKVRDYAAFAAKFLSALNIGRATLAGSSMGGWAACWFALDYPLMTDRLILISPAGLYLEDEPPMPVSLLVEEIGRYYFAAAMDERLKAGPDDELKKAIDTINVMDKAGGFRPDLAGRLEDIEAEALIIWGTGDRVIPVSYAAAFHKAIARSELRMVDGAGHLPFVEKAQEVNEVILSNFA